MRLKNSRRDLLQIGMSAAVGGLAGGAARAQAAENELEAATRRTRSKISSVQTFLLRHKLQRPSGASVSVPLSKTREALLIKVKTNDGLIGWGETEPISGARGTIDSHLAPRLIGQNPLDHRRLWREMWGPNFGNGLAVGGVETALNDLRGKALNLPVAELFGGRLRERVPVYVSALNYVEDRAIEEEYPKVAADMVARGHKAIKMRLGRYSVAREAQVAAKVRETVGTGIKLLADGNGAYTPGTALRMAHVLHELEFEFFEEPLPQVSPTTRVTKLAA